MPPPEDLDGEPAGRRARLSHRLPTGRPRRTRARGAGRRLPAVSTPWFAATPIGRCGPSISTGRTAEADGDVLRRIAPRRRRHHGDSRIADPGTTGSVGDDRNPRRTRVRSPPPAPSSSPRPTRPSSSPAPSRRDRSARSDELYRLRRARSLGRRSTRPTTRRRWSPRSTEAAPGVVSTSCWRATRSSPRRRPSSAIPVCVVGWSPAGAAPPASDGSSGNRRSIAPFSRARTLDASQLIGARGGHLHHRRSPDRSSPHRLANSASSTPLDSRLWRLLRGSTFVDRFRAFVVEKS